MQEDINIASEWAAIEDYQFKILVLVSYLAENDLAFRGSLDTMCKWLGVVNCSKNTKKIKEAIAELEQNELIFYNKEGQTHHISIRIKGLKDKRIVKIKRQWVDTIRKYGVTSPDKINRSWQTMLAALVAIFDRLEEEKGILDTSSIIMTMEELGELINRCAATAGDIAEKLTKCNFTDGLTIEKEVVRTSYKKGTEKKYKTLGTKIKATYEWENQ